MHHASEIALSDDVRPVATHSKSALLVEPLLAVGLQCVRVELRRIVAPPFTALPCVHRVFHFRVPLGNAAATMTTAKSSLPRFHFRTEDFALRAELVGCGHKEQPEKQGEEQRRLAASQREQLNGLIESKLEIEGERLRCDREAQELSRKISHSSLTCQTTIQPSYAE